MQSFMNSDKHSDWMEVGFDEALHCSDEKWGPTKYIENEMTPPPNVKTKDCYSNTSSYGQGGDFSASSSQTNEDATEDKGEDTREYDEVNVDEINQPSSSRRRLN